MSGRRRRVVNNEDSEEDFSEDTEGDDDDESEDEDNGGDEVEQEVPEIVEAAEVEVISPVVVASVVKTQPLEILKRSNSKEQAADILKREKNARRKEMKRESDSFTQAQKKNPSFVPLVGNFFLHDDRQSNKLFGEDNGHGELQLTEANLNNRNDLDLQNRTRYALQSELLLKYFLPLV